MTKSEAKARIAQLRDLLGEYRYQYHVRDRSIMSSAAAATYDGFLLTFV